MIDRFAQFPRALAEASRTARFGDVPVLLAHPDWERPAPTVLWMHGRTVSKELDPGRYLRWIRAGIAACAIDLPGHGERSDPRLQAPDNTPEVLERMIADVDRVVEHLAAPEWRGVFDLDRLAIGGMSAGGMVTLRRLCDPHPFVCAAVEATTGWLSALYFPDSVEGAHDLGLANERWAVSHDRDRIAALDPMLHLSGFRPIPLLALHTETDHTVPFAGQRRFIERLRAHYASQGADPARIELRTWSDTGAPQEHAGFGRYGADAKSTQVDFLSRFLTA